MKYITLPKTDLLVSAISLGTVPFGSLARSDAAFAVMDAYLEAGGTFIDTAHVYANWLDGERSLSEKTIGTWLRRTGNRANVVLATKGGHPETETPLVPRLAPSQIDLTRSPARGAAGGRFDIVSRGCALFGDWCAMIRSCASPARLFVSAGEGWKPL